MTGIKKFVVALLYYPKQYLKKLIAFLISIVKGYSLYRFFFFNKNKSYKSNSLFTNEYLKL